MKISIESKFEIGQTVAIKDAVQRLVINNIFTETCHGGTQILYKGILLFPAEKFRFNLENEGKEQLYIWDTAKYSEGLAINESMLEEIK